MKKEREKHLPYYDVLDALKRARECPLCELESEGLRRYVDTLLYEGVTDPGIRAELVRSKGYCACHVDVLLSFRNGLGTAILYGDQVRTFIGLLIALGSASLRAASGEVLRYAQHLECPLCRLQRENRARHVATLVDGLHHDEMRDALQSCPGLCVPHFLLAVRTTRDESVLRFLVETELKRSRELLQDLETFCRKHDYRYHHEGFGKEADSWVRAVRMIAGRAGSLDSSRT
jgi:hypothetical protein